MRGVSHRVSHRLAAGERLYTEQSVVQCIRVVAIGFDEDRSQCGRQRQPHVGAAACRRDDTQRGSGRMEVIGQQVGIVFLLLLMSFAFYNDLTRLFG